MFNKSQCGDIFLEIDVSLATRKVLYKKDRSLVPNSKFLGVIQNSVKVPGINGVKNKLSNQCGVVEVNGVICNCVDVKYV